MEELEKLREDIEKRLRSFEKIVIREIRRSMQSKPIHTNDEAHDVRGRTINGRYEYQGNHIDDMRYLRLIESFHVYDEWDFKNLGHSGWILTKKAERLYQELVNKGYFRKRR